MESMPFIKAELVDGSHVYKEYVMKKNTVLFRKNENKWLGCQLLEAKMGSYNAIFTIIREDIPRRSSDLVFIENLCYKCLCTVEQAVALLEEFDTRDRFQLSCTIEYKDGEYSPIVPHRYTTCTQIVEHEAEEAGKIVLELYFVIADNDYYIAETECMVDFLKKNGYVCPYPRGDDPLSPERC